VSLLYLTSSFFLLNAHRVFKLLIEINIYKYICDRLSVLVLFEFFFI